MLGTLAATAWAVKSRAITIPLQAFQFSLKGLHVGKDLRNDLMLRCAYFQLDDYDLFSSIYRQNTNSPRRTDLFFASVADSQAVF